MFIRVPFNNARGYALFISITIILGLYLFNDSQTSKSYESMSIERRSKSKGISVFSNKLSRQFCELVSFETNAFIGNIVVNFFEVLIKSLYLDLSPLI